jgi:hypothetical protein
MATQAYFNKIRLIVSSESVSSEVGLEISGTGMSTSIVSVQEFPTKKGAAWRRRNLRFELSTYW